MKVGEERISSLSLCAPNTLPDLEIIVSNIIWNDYPAGQIKRGVDIPAKYQGAGHVFPAKQPARLHARCVHSCEILRVESVKRLVTTCEHLSTELGPMAPRCFNYTGRLSSAAASGKGHCLNGREL